MKRHGQLYEKVCTFENILDAYKKARRNKRYKGDVLEFTSLLEENLIDIQNQLTRRTYTPGEYKKFKVFEPKERQIMALPFPDRVVQHALNTIIEPLFDKGFIFHSYACRNGKGSHEASRRLSHWLYDLNEQHGRNVYCLKADISKYFSSIDHRVLKGIIRTRIKCPDTLWLCDMIIDHNGGGTPGKGIPVGNLTSQLFANIYLTELDKYMKEELKIHYYMRYMDDFLVLSDDKAYLREILAKTENFLNNVLLLKLNPKTCIFKITQGIDFVGYRHWHTHKLIRKSSIKRITRKIKKFTEQYAAGEIDFDDINPCIQSWLGHIQHADTYGIRRKILSELVLQRNTKSKT